MKIDRKITPHLWFDSNAEEAINFYVGLFPNSAVNRLARYGDAGPGPRGQVMSIDFTLNGQDFAAINGGPQFRHSCALSLMVWCDTQEEIDFLYGKLLADGGKEQACGWVQDRFGPIWQVNYKGLPRLLGASDAEVCTRVMQAMMSMKKIDVAALEAAAKG